MIVTRKNIQFSSGYDMTILQHPLLQLFSQYDYGMCMRKWPFFLLLRIVVVGVVPTTTGLEP